MSEIKARDKAMRFFKDNTELYLDVFDDKKFEEFIKKAG